LPHQIAVLVHALHGGGAERAAAALANHWVACGHHVNLITLDRIETDAFALDSRVQRVGLGLMSAAAHPGQGLWNNLRRVRELKHAVRVSGAAVVVSLTDKMNILTLLACLPLRLPVIINERSNPARQQLGPVWEWLRRYSYPKCTAAVAQTDAVAGQLARLVSTQRVHVIPNGVRRPSRLWEDDPSLPRRIVAIGRLSREKGFDLLIRAFAELAEPHPDWQLLIAGEGPERSSLERLITELNLDLRASLPGWIESPLELLCSSRVFVLPSRYEGFPNALLEAMAAGVPVVSFACDHGPAEIVEHGVNGLLVAAEDVHGLAAELERMMLDVDLRIRLGGRAREVVQRFSNEAYFERWDRLLERSAGQVDPTRAG
jgi:glycosyltransferase involved in cell wall biosynthesis